MQMWVNSIFIVELKNTTFVRYLKEDRFYDRYIN